MFPSIPDSHADHRIRQMRDDAARTRRGRRLTAARRWQRRAERAALRAQLTRDAVP